MASSLCSVKAAARLDIYPLGTLALREVFQQITRLYHGAYAAAASELSAEVLFEQVGAFAESTRMFVKGSVEALDLIRFYPHVQPQQVLQ